MRRFLKPEEAATLPCPLARTFAKKEGPGCMAGGCPVWRWLPLDASDPKFASAITREMALLAKEAGKKTTVAFHKKAVANVMKDPEAYGVPPTSGRGWCGLGGKPEV